MEYKRTLALGSDGDILLDESKSFSMIDGVRGAIQELKVTLLTIQGEDPFNPDRGLRLFEVTGAPDAVLEREIRYALQQDHRVEAIENVRIQRVEDTRQRNVQVAVSLVDVESIQQFGVSYSE